MSMQSPRGALVSGQAPSSSNSRAFSGEPSERSERPERMRGRRVRCNAMLGRFNSARIDPHISHRIILGLCMPALPLLAMVVVGHPLADRWPEKVPEP
mgnify:CR=1 FL=1